MLHDFLTLLKTELLVTAIIFLLLFIRIGKGMPNGKLLPVIQLLLLLNFIAGFFGNTDGSLFGDMFYSNPLVHLQKSILNLGIYLIAMLFSDWLRKSEHMIEFFVLMLSAVLGMFFLVSSGNLLVFYLSLELSTIPVAAMANFDLEKRRSSESAMKMILSSAFSSAILLLGISLVYGATGSIRFNELAILVNADGLQIMAFVFLFTAFAFKLSVVPFHFWTADVYEGAPIAVTSFLSVISKGAIAFVFMTFLYKTFQSFGNIWYNMIMVLSVATMLIGNLFALRQQNIKRFLAFSSIAQVGFILVGISSNALAGFTSVVYFILVYIFSNLAAFGVAAVIEDQTGKGNISDLKGFYQTNPMLSWILALALFSLAGIPPTAGFFGKLFLLTAGASNASYWFILVAALNMIISLYYYLMVVKAIFMDKNDQPLMPIRASLPVKIGLFICAAGIVLAGIFSWVYEYISSLL